MVVSRDGDKFMLRLPEGMRKQIKQQALDNERTMNSELVYLIKMGMKEVGKQKPAAQ